MSKMSNFLSAVGFVVFSAVCTYWLLNWVNKIDGRTISALGVPVEEKYEYGMRIDTFSVFKNEVQQNEMASEILSRYKVDNQTIHAVSTHSAGIFDFRKLRAGNPYTILASKKEEDTTAHYMIYEKNPIEYIVYNLHNPEDIKLKERETSTHERVVSGEIHSSLWNTLQSLNADPDLAVKLAQVYQWTIDFTRIQAGDIFTVVCNDVYVEGKYYRSDSIKAAYVQHMGKDYYAFYFLQDSTKQAGFYDESGESLKRAFLRAPVRYSRISSRYSRSRFHPVQKRYKAHLGTDYAAPYNTPIVATGDGTVTNASYTKGNGRYVKIRHNNTYTTQYLHMNKIRSGIRSGVRVSQGEVIGYVGSTGLATGPHVCYRFWKNGKQVNHLKLDLPAGDPIEKQYIGNFEEAKRELLIKLTAAEQVPAENDDFITTISAAQ